MVCPDAFIFFLKKKIGKKLVSVYQKFKRFKVLNKLEPVNESKLFFFRAKLLCRSTVYVNYTNIGFRRSENHAFIKIKYWIFYKLLVDYAKVIYKKYFPMLKIDYSASLYILYVKMYGVTSHWQVHRDKSLYSWCWIFYYKAARKWYFKVVFSILMTLFCVVS